MNIDVIVNAGSGAGANPTLQGLVKELLVHNGLRPNVAIAGNGEEIIELAKRAARSNSELIVAGGGDGTINAVVAEILDSRKPLGVLPLGTMNHFAKDLNIPLDLEHAVQTIMKGHTAEVDLGEVNGRIFVNNSSLGLYPSIVREREKKQRLGSGKWPAYVWAAVAVLRRYPFLDIHLNVDGKTLVRRTPFVFIGNNEYEMETLNIGGRSCLDAGELSLYLTNRTGRFGLVRLAIRALFGGLRQEKDFLGLCTKEIWIRTKHKHVRVALDGEVTIMEPPLHYRVLPRKLRVLVPPPVSDKL